MQKVLFCHNDATVGNILKLPNKLMLIDYEFSCYNFRGFDIGIHFCEQAFNNHSSVYPYFEFDFENYPNKECQLNFIRSYIEQIRKITDEKAIKNHNCQIKLNEDSIIYEANLFGLSAFLQAVFWSICQSTKSSHDFGYLVKKFNFSTWIKFIFKIFKSKEFAIARCEAYFKLKKILFQNGYGN